MPPGNKSQGKVLNHSVLSLHDQFNSSSSAVCTWKTLSLNENNLNSPQRPCFRSKVFCYCIKQNDSILPWALAWVSLRTGESVPERAKYHVPRASSSRSQT